MNPSIQFHPVCPGQCKYPANGSPRIRSRWVGSPATAVETQQRVSGFRWVTKPGWILGRSFVLLSTYPASVLFYCCKWGSILITNKRWTLQNYSNICLARRTANGIATPSPSYHRPASPLQRCFIYIQSLNCTPLYTPARFLNLNLDCWENFHSIINNLYAAAMSKSKQIRRQTGTVVISAVEVRPALNRI